MIANSPPARPDADTITRIRARRRLAKAIAADGTITSYDSARSYDLAELPVSGLDHLSGLLEDLLRRQDCAVVRGGILDPARARHVRRLVHPDPKTGDAPTLQEKPHRWLAIDLDGLALPASTDPRDLLACGELARAALPPAFRSSRCIVVASGSHGLKPGARLRLWFWGDRFASGSELARWLHPHRGVVDLSIFRPAQVIYTAAPVFLDGRKDHLLRRLVHLPGAETVAIPALAALAPRTPQRAPAPLPAPSDSRAARYAYGALRNAAARISAARDGNRHPTILQEARALARLVASGLLTRPTVCDVLEAAAQQAGKPRGEAAAIVCWAMDHPSAAALPQGLRP